MLSLTPIRGLSRRGSRPSSARPFRPRLEQLEALTLPSTFQWINPAGGAWHDPANWDAGAVPGADDDVIVEHLQEDATIAITAATRVHDLYLSLPVRNDAGLRLSGAGRLAVSGFFNWEGGSLYADAGQVIQVLPGAEVNIGKTHAPPGEHIMTLNGATFVNDGTAYWIRGYFRLQAGAEFHNAGQFYVVANASDMLTTTAGTFNNTGAFYSTIPGTVTVMDGVHFTSSGDISVSAGTLHLAGTFEWTGGVISGTSDGVFRVGGHAMINPTNAGMILTLRTVTFANAGRVEWMTGHLQIDGGGTFHNAGLFDVQSVGGDIVSAVGQGGGTFHNPGTFRHGAAVNTGIQPRVAFTNVGTVEVYAGTLIFEGAFTNPGTVAVPVGTLRAQAGMVNEGHVWVGAYGTVAVAGHYVQPTGSTTLDGGTLTATGNAVFPGGVLQGSGTITAREVQQAGATILVGGAGMTGTLTVNGNFWQTAGLLNMEAGRVDGSLVHDQLVVHGAISLEGGMLYLSFLDGYAPDSGDAFEVLRGRSYWRGLAYEVDYQRIGDELIGWDDTSGSGLTFYVM